MPNILIYPIGSTLACRYASGYLQEAGLQTTDHPAPEVTHLLLDVPSFSSDGLLRGGGVPERVLEMLPQYITVIGGNLSVPALDGYRLWDLLQDDEYLSMNAKVTAECALQVAAPLLPVTLSQAPALVIGWGRIGKCLSQLLQGMGCDVTIAARKAADRAMAQALGFHGVSPGEIPTLTGYRLLINTAPEPVLDLSVLSSNPSCVKIDLASRKGLLGENVVWARGLPGIHAPETSGRLIADTVLRFIKEERK